MAMWYLFSEIVIYIEGNEGWGCKFMQILF